MSNQASQTAISPNIDTFLRSVYIPRVFNNITAERITQVFQNLELGRVHHVDFVPRLGDNQAKMAFVHFEYWNTTNTACQHLLERIHDPSREARVVYEDPYYWLLLPNHNDNATNMYNSYQIRREIDILTTTVSSLRNDFNNLHNVIDTLLTDFYEIPKSQPNNETSSSFLPSNLERIRQEQSTQQICPVCSVLLSPNATHCSACQAPLNADEKLIKILTTKPDSDEMEAIDTAGTNALNSINMFNSEKEEETPDTESGENKSTETTETTETTWTTARWFS